MIMILPEVHCLGAIRCNLATLCNIGVAPHYKKKIKIPCVLQKLQKTRLISIVSKPKKVVVVVVITVAGVFVKKKFLSKNTHVQKTLVQKVFDPKRIWVKKVR